MDKRIDSYNKSKNHKLLRLNIKFEWYNCQHTYKRGINCYLSKWHKEVPA